MLGVETAPKAVEEGATRLQRTQFAWESCRFEGKRAKTNSHAAGRDGFPRGVWHQCSGSCRLSVGSGRNSMSRRWPWSCDGTRGQQPARWLVQNAGPSLSAGDCTSGVGRRIRSRLSDLELSSHFGPLGDVVVPVCKPHAISRALPAEGYKLTKTVVLWDRQRDGGPSECLGIPTCVTSYHSARISRNRSGKCERAGRADSDASSHESALNTIAREQLKTIGRSKEWLRSGNVSTYMYSLVEN